MNLRLEINSKGSWKILDRFHADSPQYDTAMAAGKITADTVNAISGQQNARLRICTDERSPRVIKYYEQGKWQLCN